ncbi:MAG: hypothetical protein Kow0081_2260 [Candidatus Dojkabacteria bacterium]
MKTKNAFTLIELLVVMGVIAVLVGMSVFGISALLEAQRDTERRNAGKNLQVAIEAFRNRTTDGDFYPAALEKRSDNSAINLLDSSNNIVTTVPLEGTAKTTAFCYELDSSEVKYKLGVLLDDQSTWEQFGTAQNPDGSIAPCETENV